MNANFGLVEELPNAPRDKRAKREQLAARALSEMRAWIAADSVPREHAVAESAVAR
jgi:folate-dependent tRNA-U54 methylase TrmFO/GidA